jgi:hypothetical protein
MRPGPVNPTLTPAESVQRNALLGYRANLTLHRHIAFSGTRSGRDRHRIHGRHASSWPGQRSPARPHHLTFAVAGHRFTFTATAQFDGAAGALGATLAQAARAAFQVF